MATGITTLSLVIVPVTDQERAIAFYESLGLEKQTDVPMGDGYRWVEVYVPGDTTGIALSPPPPGQPVVPANTGITLNTKDIKATHAEMTALGVDVDAEIMEMGGPVPPMFWFRDPEGHTLLIVESQD